jgi:hypothetical protein
MWKHLISDSMHRPVTSLSRRHMTLGGVSVIDRLVQLSLNPYTVQVPRLFLIGFWPTLKKSHVPLPNCSASHQQNMSRRRLKSSSMATRPKTSAEILAAAKQSFWARKFEPDYKTHLSTFSVKDISCMPTSLPTKFTKFPKSCSGWTTRVENFPSQISWRIEY